MCIFLYIKLIYKVVISLCWVQSHYSIEIFSILDCIFKCWCYNKSLSKNAIIWLRRQVLNCFSCWIIFTGFFGLCVQFYCFTKFDYPFIFFKIYLLWHLMQIYLSWIYQNLVTFLFLMARMSWWTLRLQFVQMKAFTRKDFFYSLCAKVSSNKAFVTTAHTNFRHVSYVREAGLLFCFPRTLTSAYHSHKYVYKYTCVRGFSIARHCSHCFLCNEVNTNTSNGVEGYHIVVS